MNVFERENDSGNRLNQNISRFNFESRINPESRIIPDSQINLDGRINSQI